MSDVFVGLRVNRTTVENSGKWWENGQFHWQFEVVLLENHLITPVADAQGSRQLTPPGDPYGNATLIRHDRYLVRVLRRHDDDPCGKEGSACPAEVAPVQSWIC